MSVREPSAEPVIPSIVEQHADEAAFLWTVRDHLVYAPHVTLADLARHDERLEAHLDGLRVAGEAGWALCRAAIDAGEPGALFAAAVLAFEGGQVGRLRDVLTAAVGAPAFGREAASALGWVPVETAWRVAERLLRARDPALRRIGLAGLALHRRDPGVALGEALIADDPRLLARALRAAGELGRLDLLPLVRGHAGANDVEVRVWAAWSAALLAGDAAAIRTLAEFVEAPPPEPADAPA